MVLASLLSASRSFAIDPADARSKKLVRCRAFDSRQTIDEIAAQLSVSGRYRPESSSAFRPHLLRSEAGEILNEGLEKLETELRRHQTKFVILGDRLATNMDQVEDDSVQARLINRPLYSQLTQIAKLRIRESFTLILDLSSAPESMELPPREQQIFWSHMRGILDHSTLGPVGLLIIAMRGKPSERLGYAFTQERFDKYGRPLRFVPYDIIP